MSFYIQGSFYTRVDNLDCQFYTRVDNVDCQITCNVILTILRETLGCLSQQPWCIRRINWSPCCAVRSYIVFTKQPPAQHIYKHRHTVGILCLLSSYYHSKHIPSFWNVNSAGIRWTGKKTFEFPIPLYFYFICITLYTLC